MRVVVTLWELVITCKVSSSQEQNVHKCEQTNVKPQSAFKIKDSIIGNPSQFITNPFHPMHYIDTNASF
jgi:hypothetical protein